MIKSRRIKIAVIAESTLWESIQTQISNNYYFELPKSIIPKEEDKSANFAPEFIKYDQSLAALSEIGNDPYLRPFLYLYIVSIKNDEIDSETIDKITRWIENNKILSNTYLVILIQEDKKVFGNSKPINMQQITSSAEDNNDIIIISVKPKKQATEQFIEDIKVSIREHIINDCEKYSDEIDTRLKSAMSNPRLKQRLRVWKNLLSFFYGYFNISQEGFYKEYKRMTRRYDFKLDDLLKFSIEPEQINTHPFTGEQDFIDSLIFALNGMLAVSYARTDFSSLANYFFMHFGYLRSKCRTKEENERVNHWGEESIDTILKLFEITSHTQVASNLLFRKMQLIRERDGPAREISTLYRTIRKLIPSRKYMVTLLDTYYLSWKSEKRKDVHTKSSAQNDQLLKDNSFQIDFDQADEADAINNFQIVERARPSLLGWKNVTSVIEAIFKDKFPADDLEIAIPCALNLLSSKSQFDRKGAVFDSFVDIKKTYTFQSPFDIKVKMESPVFEKVITASCPFTIFVTVETPEWFPSNYDVAMIRLLRPINAPPPSSEQSPQTVLTPRNRKSIMAQKPPQGERATQAEPHQISRSRSLSLTRSQSTDFNQTPTADMSYKGLTLSAKNDETEKIETRFGVKRRTIVFKDVFIRAPGNWYASYFAFKFKNLTIFVNLTSSSYLIKVDKGINAPITVDFPKVFNLSKGKDTILKTVLTIDYSNIASPRITHRMSFIDDLSGLIEACKNNEINLSVIDKSGKQKSKKENVSNVEVSMNTNTTSYKFERSNSKSGMNLNLKEISSVPACSPLSISSTFGSSCEIPSFGQTSPQTSSCVFIPEQTGTTTFSDGSQTEFRIENNGNLSFTDESFSPVLKVATIPFNIAIKAPPSAEDDDFSLPDSTTLLVDSRIDSHKWSVAFVHALDSPIQCTSRIVTEKVIHFELKNTSTTKLTIKILSENPSLDSNKDIVIRPGKSYFLIHTNVNEPLRILVSDGFGEPVEKVWNLDKSMSCQELIANMDKKNEYQTGVPIICEFDLPKGSFKILKNKSLVVVGKTKMAEFDGGKVTVQIIPVGIGTIEMPKIKINGVVHSVRPKFLKVTSSSTMSLGPFLDRNC